MLKKLKILFVVFLFSNSVNAQIEAVEKDTTILPLPWLNQLDTVPVFKTVPIDSLSYFDTIYVIKFQYDTVYRYTDHFSKPRKFSYPYRRNRFGRFSNFHNEDPQYIRMRMGLERQQ